MIGKSPSPPFSQGGIPVSLIRQAARHIIQCCLVNSVRTIWGQFMRAGEQSCAFHFFRDRGFTPIVRLRLRKVRYRPDRFPKLEAKTRHLSWALKESGRVPVQGIVLFSPD